MTTPDAAATLRWLRTDSQGAAVVEVAARPGLVAELDAARCTRALAAARGGSPALLGVDAVAVIALPEPFDEPLALLAADLARVRAALDERAPAAEVVLAPYDVRAALLHVELVARAPETRVVALDRSPLRRTVAAAFGAEAREPGARDAPAPSACGDGRTPARAEIAAALAAIAAEPWRYRPLLTSVTTLDEERPDAAGELATALVL